MIKTPPVCQESNLGCLPTAITEWHFPITSPFMIGLFSVVLTVAASFAAATALLDVTQRWEERKCLGHFFPLPGLHLGLKYADHTCRI